MFFTVILSYTTSMHAIEPYFLWRDIYIASDDEKSPFHGVLANEFFFDKKVYNYLIHPQWDEFGSETLYLKILFVDYDNQFAIIELIGEWNDTLNNDVAALKEQVIDLLMDEGIKSFILLGENIYNFHGSDDCYYEEWVERVEEEEGFIAFVNFLPHVINEMEDHDIHQHIYMGPAFSNIAWRPMKPGFLYKDMLQRIEDLEKGILYLD